MRFSTLLSALFGKGQKSRVIPLRGRIVLEVEHYMLEPLPLLGRPPEPDDFILYPEKRTAGGRLLAAYPKAPYERAHDSSLVV